MLCAQHLGCWWLDNTQRQCTSRHGTDLIWLGNVITIKSLIQAAPNLKTLMFLLSSCIYHCPIHWNQGLSREWRCSWSSVHRRCSNYVWVINAYIAYKDATYIRGLMVDWNMQTLSVLLALCEGKPWVNTSGFPSQTACNMELLCFLWCTYEQRVKHIVEFQYSMRMC